MIRRSTYYQAFAGLLLIFFLAGWQHSFAQDTTNVSGQLQQRQPQNTQQRPGESANQPQKEGQINFQASDSLVFDFQNGREATLFGSSSVTHSSGQLKAGKIAMNLNQHIVSANTQTPQDTLSQPVLIRDDQRVRSNSIKFNYQTEKGRFEVARIEVQDGNLIGTKVKNTNRHVIFLEDAKYSTCQLDHPHYYIQADRMKIVDREKVFFEKARLFILDIPYPLVFPFGYLPGKFDKKQSGILEPTYAYQQRQSRGIGLQDLGWFQYFNDYLTAQASFDIFTSGSYFVDAQTTYRLRNELNGSVQIGYSRENSGLEPTDPDFRSTIQKQLQIRHNQDFSPYSSFNTSINLRTEDFYKQNSYDPTQRAETNTRSNINYRYRHPENTYNFDVSIRQSQNFLTNTTTLSGPQLNFNLKRLSPFENRQTSGQNNKWYETLTVKYQNSFNSRFEYQPTRRDSARYNWFEALMDPSKYRKATGNNDHYKYGFRQQADISMNQIIPSRFINVSASANYNEYWFPTTTRKTFLPDSNKVIEQQVRGFESARDFNTSLNFSTTVYGMMNAKIGNMESFRHTMRPSISLSYRPDFSSDFWGYYRTVKVDTANGGRFREYSIFENEIFRGPGQGEQRALNFSLRNVFEAKSVKRDSTGEKKEETIRLIDQLNLNSSYNFAADSLKLSDLNASLNAGILPGMNIRANASFNFYERDTNGNKIDRFLLATANKPMELTRFSASTSYSVKLGENGLVTNDKPHYPRNYDPLNQRMFHPVDPHFNSRPVQDFNSPFSFSINFNYNWNLNARGDSPRTSATINANNISLNLTPKWNFRTQIGYDFVRKKLTPSQFSLNRNLHCWDLSFTMNPFGDNKYYFFSLRINAGRLQSIIQKLPGLKNLERGSNTTGRAPRGF